MSEYEQLSFDFMTDFIDTAKFTGKIFSYKMKKCTKCGLTKEANSKNFTKHISSKDKLSTWCTSCKYDRVTSKKQDKLKNTNLCIRCDKERLTNSQCCSFHHIYILLKSQKTNNRFKNLDSKEKTKIFITALLQKLENQNYKCAITGDNLELGVNASLDHIIEKCNGGSCDLDNLQWVTKKANNSKPRKFK